MEAMAPVCTRCFLHNGHRAKWIGQVGAQLVSCPYKATGRQRQQCQGRKLKSSRTDRHSVLPSVQMDPLPCASINGNRRTRQHVLLTTPHIVNSDPYTSRLG